MKQLRSHILAYSFAGYIYTNVYLYNPNSNKCICPFIGLTVSMHLGGYIHKHE